MNLLLVIKCDCIFRGYDMIYLKKNKLLRSVQRQ